MQSEALKKIADFRLDTLKSLLAQCTQAQRDFFGKLYPEGVDEIADSKIDWAIQQCENSIKKNKKAQTTV